VVRNCAVAKRGATAAHKMRETSMKRLIGLIVRRRRAEPV
jgi:hypothetical protein